MKDLMWLADNWDDEEHNMTFKEYVQVYKCDLSNEKKSQENESAKE